jgi:hypothetical protein
MGAIDVDSVRRERRWRESSGGRACLLGAVDFFASAWATVAVFSAIYGALNEALIRGSSIPGIAAWCEGKRSYARRASM